MTLQTLPVGCNSCVLSCGYPFQIADEWTLNLSFQVGPIPPPSYDFPFVSYPGALNYVPATCPNGSLCEGCPNPCQQGIFPCWSPLSLLVNSKYNCGGCYPNPGVFGSCLEWLYVHVADYGKYAPGCISQGNVNMSLTMQRSGIPQSYRDNWFTNSPPRSAWTPSEASDYYGGSLNDFDWSNAGGCSPAGCPGSPYYSNPGFAFDKQGYIGFANPCAPCTVPLPSGLDYGPNLPGCPGLPCECTGGFGNQICTCAPPPILPGFDPADPSNSATGFIKLDNRFGVSVSAVVDSQCNLWIFLYFLDKGTTFNPLYYWQLQQQGQGWCPPAPAPILGVGKSWLGGIAGDYVGPGPFGLFPCGYQLNRGGFQIGCPNDMVVPAQWSGGGNLGMGLVPITLSSLWGEGGIIDGDPGLHPTSGVCDPGNPESLGLVFPFGGAHCCCRQMADSYTLTIQGNSAIPDGSYNVVWTGANGSSGGGTYCYFSCDPPAGFIVGIGSGITIPGFTGVLKQTIQSCAPLIVTGEGVNGDTTVFTLS